MSRVPTCCRTDVKSVMFGTQHCDLTHCFKLPRGSIRRKFRYLWARCPKFRRVVRVRLFLGTDHVVSRHWRAPCICSIPGIAIGRIANIPEDASAGCEKKIQCSKFFLVVGVTKIVHIKNNKLNILFSFLPTKKTAQRQHVYRRRRRPHEYHPGWTTNGMVRTHTHTRPLGRRAHWRWCIPWYWTFVVVVETPSRNVPIYIYIYIF